MIKTHCSTPTTLDNIFFKYKKVKVLQAYNPTIAIMNNFKDISNKIVILVYLGEYHTYKWIEEILCNSKNHYLNTGKIKNYYIILSLHEYPKNLINEYGDFFTVIHEPLLYNYYTDHFEKHVFKKNIKYHFLSLNNRASISRQSLYYFFHKFSLLEKSYFSYLGDISRTIYKNLDEITKEIVSYDHRIPWFMKNLNYLNLDSQIPFRISGDLFNVNDWSCGQNKYYEETFCSLVFETYDDQEFPFLTEKTWKPIAFGHPFIVYSNKDALKQLHDLGFKTFDNFWDEDYDLLSGIQRLEFIFHLILEISNWSMKKINLIYEEALPIIEHNQNHFFNTIPEIYESKFPLLVKKIETIIEEKIDII